MMAEEPMMAEDSRISRRRFVSLGAGAFVVLSLPLALRRRRALVRRSIPVMGTIAEVAVVHEDPRSAHLAIDAAMAELRWVDRTMSRFSPLSDVGRANLGAAAAPVTVSEETAIVLRESLRWADLSDGRFDPCLGQPAALWNFGSRRRPPPTAEIRRYAGESLYRHLELDASNGRACVRFHSGDVSIDVGGIAKGYAVDRAVRALRERGVTDALVNAGGDLYAMGTSENGDPWRVGIRSPDDPRRLAATIPVSDRAIATSGDYFQYFDYGGRRFHHLLDPATGEPRRSGLHSVTVAADSCMAADAGATAVFGCEPARASRLLGAAAPGAEIIHGV
jgi:thiamine biosynthesis lipoprotein